MFQFAYLRMASYSSLFNNVLILSRNIDQVRHFSKTMLNLNAAHLLRAKSYINGKWVDSKNGSKFDVTNPANGKVNES